MSDLTPTQKSILETAAGRADGSIHPLPGHIKGGAARKVIDALRNKGLIQVEADTISEAGFRAMGLELPRPVEDFEKDVAAAEAALTEVASSLPTQEETHPKEQVETEALNAMFEKIALDHLFIDTLETRKSDSLDFHEVSVWGVKHALMAAYDAGLQAAQRKPIPRKTGPREHSKQAQVIALLKRPEGATTAQIAEVTGWLPTSIRGFISSAKKKFGLTITAQRTRTAGQNRQGSPGSYSTYRVAG